MGQTQSLDSEKYELLKQDEQEEIESAEILPTTTDLCQDSSAQELLVDNKDDDDDTSALVRDLDANEETMFSITIEIFLPFLVAGFGMVAAGVVLDIVQHWKVFQELNQLFILVPALLGLKGNLEMTLASRLSTQVSHFLLLMFW